MTEVTLALTTRPCRVRELGQLIHSLHTPIIDRQRRLAANLEGNEFTAEQLGDLVQSVLKSGTANPSGL